MMSTRMVLRKAACAIAEGKNTMCCYAIEDQHAYAAEGAGVANDWFHALYCSGCDNFKKNGKSRTSMTFWSDDPTPERQAIRVLMLLFAAESYRE